MLKFLKTHSYDIFKLFLTQIALAIFALVMTMWTFTMGPVFLGVGIFCAGFYIYLIYLFTYQIGSEDRPAVAGGRAVANYLKGLWITLTANSINIICGIMVFVFGFFIVYQQPVTVYNEAGDEMELYYKVTTPSAIEGEEPDVVITPIKALYSDSGDDVFTYDNGKRLVTLKLQYASGQTLVPCDKDGNEFELYSVSGGIINTQQNAVETWASDLYGVPMVIATFTQSMFKAIHTQLFANADWFYLIMPIPVIIAGALGYFMAVRGKRLLFFLPEMKESKRKRAKY